MALVEAGHRARSHAGQLALQRALVNLARQLDLSAQVPVEGFGLAQGPSGEPRVVAVPPGFKGDGGALRVSIAHTKAHAWAVAAIEVDADG